MESKENVKKYYDDYVSRQRKYGITPRHLFILKRLKKFGLKSNSKVLEIGSGIGTLSLLIVNHHIHRETPEKIPQSSLYHLITQL